jgi:ankyrin repeat protein
MQSLLINSVVRDLDDLHLFTFTHGMRELHEHISKRLACQSLFETKEFQEITNWIENDNSEKILSYLQSKKQVNEEDYIILVRACQLGKAKLVRQSYPYFKRTAAFKDFPPLHIAVKNNQYDIIKVLKEIGADIHQKNLFNKNAVSIAIRYQRYDAILLLCDTQDNTLNETIILDAIEQQSFNLVEKLVTGLKSNIATSSIPKFMESAIKAGNLDILKFLFLCFKNIRPLEKLLKCCLQTTCSNTSDIFNFLYSEIITNNRFDEVFKDNNLLEMLINTYKKNPKFFESYKELKKIIEKQLNKKEIDKSEKILNVSDNDRNRFQYVSKSDDAGRVGIISSERGRVKANSEEIFDILRLLKSDNIEHFESLISNSLNIVNKNNIDIILALLLKRGFSKIFKWIYEKATYLLDKNTILQRIINTVSSIPGCEFAPNFEKCLSFLLEEIRVDVNISSPEYLKVQNKQILFFLLENKNTNLSAQDQNGQNILHLSMYCDDDIKEKVLDIYLNRNLDINAKDKFGNTPLECLLENQKFSQKIYDTFLTNSNKAVSPRSYRSYKGIHNKLKLYFVIGTYDKEVYVIVYNKKYFLSTASFLHSKMYPFTESFTNINIEINLVQIGKSEVRSIPKNAAWVKIPYSFEETSQETYLFSNSGTEVFEINRLTKELLEFCVSSYSRQQLPSPSEEQTTRWLSEAENMIKQLDALYEPILNKNPPSSSTDFVKAIQRIGIPYACWKFNEYERYYQKFDIYSLLIAAVVTEQVMLVKEYLQQENFCNFIGNVNLLHCAIEIGNIEILKLLLQADNSLAPDTAYTYLKHAEMVNSQDEILITILEYVKPMSVPKGERIVFIKWLNKYCKPNTSESGEVSENKKNFFNKAKNIIYSYKDKPPNQSETDQATKKLKIQVKNNSLQDEVNNKKKDTVKEGDDETASGYTDFWKKRRNPELSDTDTETDSESDVNSEKNTKKQRTKNSN